MRNFIKQGANSLSEDEKRRFRAYCCGLCRSIGYNFGVHSRLAFNYNIAFLIMFLSSAYNEKGYIKPGKCIKHPYKKCEYFVCDIADYAAAISLIMAYYKAESGANNPKNLAIKKAFSKKLQKIEKRYKKHCELIKKHCKIVYSKADYALRLESCGDLASVIFSPFDDALCEDLSRFGYAFGKMLYAKNCGVAANSAELEAQCFEAYNALKLKKDSDIITHILFKNTEITER